MVVLATGASFAKMLGILAMPIITRIYTPEHLGVLAMYTALVALLVPLATLRYSFALPLPQNDRIASNLAALCFILLLITSFLVFLILLFFSDQLLKQLNMSYLLPYWWLLVLGFFSTGFYEILTQWATREKAFKTLAKTQVWQSALGAALKVILGIFGIKPLGLLLGQLVTQAGGGLLLAFSFFKKFKENYKYLCRNKIVFLLKFFSGFPKYRLPSQFLLVLAIQAPLVFSTWHFGIEATGQLALALMALALPVALLGQTMGQAYYAEIARIGKSQPKKLTQVTKQVVKNLFMLGLLPCLMLTLFAPGLFEIAFGQQWREAGELAKILSIYIVFQFASGPVASVFSVLKKERLYLYINLARVVFVFLSLFFSFYFYFDFKAYVLLYSILVAVSYILTLIVVFLSLNKAARA